MSFNYYCSCCILKNDSHKPYFKNLDHYLEQNDDEVALTGAAKLGTLLYGLNNDYMKDLPENQFLRKYNFMNDDLRLINKEGKLVDREGHLVDDEGRYLNDDGEFVDKLGNPVDADGNFNFEFSEFLDDDGKPVDIIKKEENAEDIEKEVPTTKDAK